MADKKKAYRRFEELTRRATAPMADEAPPDQGVMNQLQSSPADALQIRLSPEVRRALEDQALAENTTPAEIVEEALRRYLGMP